MLDRTGLSKEQKELVNQIKSRLATIARLGRAFGIHLILATQRPDANLISGLCSMTGQFFRDTCLMKQIFEQ